MHQILNFFEEVFRLKRTPRAGFWYYGVKDPESVAEHIFGVALITYISGKLIIEKGQNLNLERAIKMAIIHELGEALIGDIHLEARRYLGKCVDTGEKKAFEDISSTLPISLRDELLELYEEFNQGKTIEAKLVRSADKVDLLIQAHIYEKTGYKNLESFFNEDKNFEYIKQVPFFAELIENLKQRRAK